MPYDDFAAYRATLNRLHGFTRAIDDAVALPAPDVQSEGQRLALRDVKVCKPDGSVLIDELNLELAPGQTLLIHGPSGSGKTTLLRTIAGLWPYSQGEIVRPDENALFLSQQPYLPLGSLREALYYPFPPADKNDEAKNILHAIQLGHLANRLEPHPVLGRTATTGLWPIAARQTRRRLPQRSHQRDGRNPRRLPLPPAANYADQRRPPQHAAGAS